MGSRNGAGSGADSVGSRYGAGSGADSDIGGCVGRGGCCGLMDRALDLKPEVTQGCGFESRLRQEVHDCSPAATQLASQVCALGWVKCRENIKLCIIVYVTNKANLSLICVCICVVEEAADVRGWWTV